MDSRDDPTWVTVELTRQGEEKASDGTLAAELCRVLGVEATWPVFVPTKTYFKNGRRCSLHLMQGYAFVGSGLDEVRYFRLPHRSPLVEKVLSTIPAGSRLRVLQVIPNSKILELKAQMLLEASKDVEVHSMVNVVQGHYRGLHGEVIDILSESEAQVLIQLRSLVVYATIPKAFLEISED